MRRWFLVAAVLLATGALFLAVREGAEPDRSVEGHPSAGRTLPAPSLKGTATATEAVASPVPENPGAAGDARGEVALLPAHRVEGRIEGLSPDLLRATTVRVHLLGSYDWINRSQDPAVATPDEDGRFRIDVAALRAQVPTAGRIQVSVDHPAFVVARVKVDLAPLAAGVTHVADPIRLEPASRVPVVVHDPDGKAAGADVALVQMDGERPAVDAAGEVVVLATGRADAEGHVVLRTPVEGPALLAAHLHPHLPASERLHAGADETTPIVLRLGRGASISGRVTVNGTPLAGAHLRTTPQPAPEVLALGTFSGVWLDGRIVPVGSHVAADETGYFEVHGLEPGPHRVCVGGFETHLLFQGEGMGLCQDVEAPAQGIQIDVAAAVVVLRVVCGGEPVEGAHVMVGREDAGYIGSVTRDDGVQRFLVPPHATWEVRVEHEHFDARRVLPLAELLPGEVRERAVDLGPARAEGSLVVVLRDAAGVPVTRAGFRLTAPESSDLGLFEEGLREREAEDGIFHLHGLAAGPATLVVTPGRGPNDYRGRFLLLAEPVTILPDRQVDVELTARRGARVFLLVTNEAGEPLEASATIRDDRGEEIEVLFAWSDEDSATESSGGPGPWRSLVEPPLAPGSYEIECAAAGYRRQHTRFVAVADTDLELTVRLTKE